MIPVPDEELSGAYSGANSFVLPASAQQPPIAPPVKHNVPQQVYQPPTIPMDLSKFIMGPQQQFDRFNQPPPYMETEEDEISVPDENEPVIDAR